MSMKPSELLRIIGKPIAYYPQLAKPLGGVNASLLFGHFFYWNDKGRSELGVYRTADEIEAETGLSRDEQRTARRKLRERGVLIETEKRIEHRIYYKLDLDRFDEIISQSGSGDFPIADSDIPNPEVGNSQSGSGDFPIDEVGNYQSYIRTEDYQKTTTVDYYNNNAPAAAGAESSADNPPEKPKATSGKKPNRHQADLDLLAEFGVTGQIADDHLEIRKAKRQPLTRTAMLVLKAEAEKCGLTTEQAVEYAVGNGWASFRAEYLQNKAFGGNGSAKPVNKINQIPQHTKGGAFLAKDIF